jgi:hypothetical protein
VPDDFDPSAYEPVSDFLHEVRRVHGEAPSYHAFWAALQDGRVRAIRKGRYWLVCRDQVPAVAAMFGLGSRRPAA